ncbi:MAG: translocation and assembly module lipoprotein TamL [Bacteroidota bacterium]
MTRQRKIVQPNFCAVCAAVILYSVIVTGCSSVSYLAPGEKLYTGAEVTIVEQDETGDSDILEDQLNQLIKPEPNTNFLGVFRYKLWLYNIGIFKESLGEPPVLLRSVAAERIAARMRTVAENNGYFWSDVGYAVQEDEHTADIRYTVALRTPYSLGTVTVKGNGPDCIDTIRSSMEESLLIPGEQYSLDNLRRERERIDAVLKDKGYFYFSPDFIQFQADSAAGNATIDIVLQIKKDIPPEATRAYSIGRIYIYSGYSLNRDSTRVPIDSAEQTDGYYFIDLDREFDPDVITRSVFFRTGSVYGRADHERTLNRLMNLGVFKYVNIAFINADSAGSARLDPHIYLTPLLMKSIRLELQAVSKSNNLVGPVLEVGYRDKNLFGGAELLKLSLESGFEIPLSTGHSGGNSYLIGMRAELDLPKFVTPFDLGKSASLFVPKTRIILGGMILHRLQYYQMLSVDASFGYTWKPTLSTEHNFNPLSASFAHLTQTTDIFNDLLNANPLLRKSFEEQFIIGENYSFTYNDQFEKEKKNHVYFKGSIDLSGNLIYLAQSAVAGRASTFDAPYRIFGLAYSQFSKIDIDLRYYYNTVEQTSSLAGRFIAGIGVAYGNSSTMPYGKQFFIGGSNSVRAFVLRGLGPGSYDLPDSIRDRSFIDQAGDIKLEASIEYRFPIVSIFNGALFVDAGNIWLLRDDPSRPGGMFTGTTFLDEVAVGTGVGVRCDLSFFILRLDIAIPLRVPSLPLNDRWVISKIDFGDPSWRGNNLSFNIAIGYPF